MTSDARSVSVGRAGLAIDGQEQVLLCASLFYFRIPREEWAERLEAVRASGYQMIDVYIPWNFHEITPGRWDFEGRRDVGRFLDMAHEAGLLVMARPGPYICSEWDGGGLPAWLSLTEGLRHRQADAAFLTAVQGWFDTILPVLRTRERGAGGAVVALQLENELDFFDCADRPGYMAALRAMAEEHGITVPLVGCAGQGDLYGATGDVPDVVPACNFYPSDHAPGIEAEVRHYAALLAERNLPLVVTETNRAHVTLRRLLVSGAKVIAPYLQASGYDFGYTPSVGNWGDPGGFMSHDYDFGGFLSPLGEPRAESVDARRLTAVTRTLGARLARARTASADGAYRTDAPTSSSPSVLDLDGGGTLLGVPNLGDRIATATLAPVGEVPEVEIDLPAHSCTFVVRDLPLEGFGLRGVLRCATGDLVDAGPPGLTFVTEVASVVLVETPDGVVRLDLPAPSAGQPVTRVVGPAAEPWSVSVLAPADVPAPDGLLVADATAAHAPETIRIEAARALTTPARRHVSTRWELPPSSEEVGVYRGRTHYATDVAGMTELLIHGASDIVDLALAGKALATVARFGATERVTVAGATTLTATVETWGHSNFDDARLPALRIGSLRGLGRVWTVRSTCDVSDRWEVHGGDRRPGDPAPLRTVAGWSSTRIGQPVTYRRSLILDGPGALCLHGVTTSVTVTVDGVEHLVTAEEPWVFLDACGVAEVSVTMPHTPGHGLGVELLYLEPVVGWDVEPQPDTALLDLAASPANGHEVALPLTFDAGAERWVDVTVPTGGSLRFEGQQLRISAFAAGELLGRVWLDDPARPPFTGGDPARLWLPDVWSTGRVRLLLHGTAGPHRPTLRSVTLTTER